MRDVDYVMHKGTYRFKALTPRAKKVFSEFLEMPYNLVEDEKAEVFITGIKPDKFLEWIEELTKHGFQTENDPPAALAAPPAEMWTF